MTCLDRRRRRIVLQSLSCQGRQSDVSDIAMPAPARRRAAAREVLAKSAGSLDGLIGGYAHLSTKSHARDALALLSSLAAEALPLVKKHGWRIGLLREFYPSQSNLLGTNLNRGQVVSLRLRPASNEHEFLPFDDLMGTLLHELAHNEVGPHDARFYALLDELNVEYDALLAARKAHSQAKALGGRGKGNGTVTLAEAKRRAVARALGQARGTGVDGKVLGGSTSHPAGTGATADGSTAAAVAAAASSRADIKARVAEAALRRRHDSLWCGHGREDDPVLVDDDAGAGGEQETVTAACPDGSAGGTVDVCKQPSADEIIEITSSDDDAEIDARHVAGIADDPASTAAASAGVRQGRKRRHQPIPGLSATHVPPAQKHARCANDADDDRARMKRRGLLADNLQTHLAKLASARLERLDAPRASARSDRATSDTADVADDDDDDNGAGAVVQWHCPRCTLRNAPSRAFCAACAQPRLSIDVLPCSTTGIATRHGATQHGGAPTAIDQSQSQRHRQGQKAMTWRCTHCSVVNERDFWSCRGCTRVKRTS